MVEQILPAQPFLLEILVHQPSLSVEDLVSQVYVVSRVIAELPFPGGKKMVIWTPTSRIGLEDRTLPREIMFFIRPCVLAWTVYSGIRYEDHRLVN